MKANLHASQALFERKKFQIEDQNNCSNDAISHHIECIRILKKIDVKPELAEEYF